MVKVQGIPKEVSIMYENRMNVDVQVEYTQTKGTVQFGRKQREPQ